MGPLALVSLLPRLEKALPKRGVVLPGLFALLSPGVFLRGLSFEIWPSLAAAHPIGAEHLVAENRRMAQATGLAPGTRVALAGPFDMVQPLPLPVLGLVGSTVILSGLESAHLYEPMEPAWVSRGHYELSLPWRVALSADLLLKRPSVIFQALASIGVQAVVTIEPKAWALPRSQGVQGPTRTPSLGGTRTWSPRGALPLFLGAAP